MKKLVKENLKKGIILVACFSMLFGYVTFKDAKALESGTQGTNSEGVEAYADPASSFTFNGLTITADDGNALATGTAAEAELDIYTTGNIIYIQTNRSLTVTGTTTSTALAIAQGTKANITLNGVSITHASASPINLIPNTVADQTTLYLTIADGSVNTLKATGVNAGIHVSHGSKLTIDDALKNWGTVEGGRIVGETDENGTPKPSWLMDSANPGTLNFMEKTAVQLLSMVETL